MRLRSGKTRRRGTNITIGGILVFVTLFALASGEPIREVKNNDFSTDKVDLLNASMFYIEKKHPETSEYINSDTSWRMADQEVEDKECETWSEESGWIATIDYSSSIEDTYTVWLLYDGGISWKGRVNSSMVEETGYNFTLTEKEKDIKDRVMEYLVEKHPEVSEHMDYLDNFDWERTGSKILTGYSEFIYTCDGWKMTIGSAVTAPEYKTFEIVLENPEDGIRWVGVIKNNTITEKMYKPN